MRHEQDIVETLQRHSDTVMRVCSIYLREPADRDDMFQETFLRYAENRTVFESEEHRKAWLIRTASNACKDQLKRSNRNDVPFESVNETHRLVDPRSNDGQERIEAQELLGALYRIDEKYRIVLYLKYYEDRTAAQIAKMLDIPENTVYTHLARGKKELKEVLARDGYAL